MNIESNQTETVLSKEDAQIQFFTDQEPANWYPVQRNKKGRIQVDLPASLRKKKGLIYVWRKKKQQGGKERLLIGKTGGSLNTRVASYVSKFNEVGSENRVKKKGSKAFLIDMKKHPEHFEIGILHVLQPDEDLDLFESLFIKHKGTLYDLYNENGGGGGGSSHLEEATVTYAIPKPMSAAFTPEKYYPFEKDEHGCIRPQFTPTFKRKVEELREEMDEQQEYVYAIKKRKEESAPGKYYIGVTGNPLRPKQHAYAAEYCDPQHEKYDPSHTSGYLHEAMAANPDQFEFGLFPVRSVDKIDQDQLDNHVLLKGINKVENDMIKLKQAHISQNGFNGNYGGGEPIAKRATRLAKKRLEFDALSP